MAVKVTRRPWGSAEGEAVWLFVLEAEGQAVVLPRKAVSQVRLVPDLSALDEEEQ